MSLTEELLTQSHTILTKNSIPDGTLPRRIETLVDRLKVANQKIADQQEVIETLEAKLDNLRAALDLYVDQDR